jgi:hypothetical protein
VLLLLPEFRVFSRIEARPSAREILTLVEHMSPYEIEPGIRSAGNAECKWQRLFREGRAVERHEQIVKHDK